MTAGVFSYALKQSVLIHSEIAISLIIYTLRFASKSATYRYENYADVKSESVVLRARESRIFEFMQA